MSKKYMLFGVTAFLVVLIDQATKVCVMANLNLYDTHPVIAGFFNITYVRNPGAAFGFLAGASPLFRYTFFTAVTVAAILLILYYVRTSKTEEKFTVLSLAFIMAGAVGNLIDRVRFGEVVDFLDVYLGAHHWPAFNVADASISIGAVILVWEMIRRGKEK